MREENTSPSWTYWANRWIAEDRFEATHRRLAEHNLGHHGDDASLREKQKIATSRRRGLEAGRAAMAKKRRER